MFEGTRELTFRNVRTSVTSNLLNLEPHSLPTFRHLLYLDVPQVRRASAHEPRQGPEGSSAK